ncbi:MAG: serine hydrolase [Paenibacillaceae bacterium]|nr:serine hydrolase [Paenibacillaceae bacterium]
MLLRRGNVVAEGWWAPYGEYLPHMMFSLSKSFTSTAIGMAIEEGKFGLHDHVLSFFPERADELAASPAFADNRDRLSRLTVRHLLTMASGHGVDTLPALMDRKDGDWVKAFLESPLVHEPGTAFVYNSGATYVLSAILQRATGEKLRDYLQPRLFAPLGIEGAAWDECPQGVTTGGWGLWTTTEAIAKFGRLYAQLGAWEGRRLVAEEWVREATSAQIDNGDASGSNTGNSDWQVGYGYQFWRCRHGAYRGDGAFGQYCIVFPEQDAVLAITSGVGDMQAVLDAVWAYVLPALNDVPTAGVNNAEADAQLVERLASLALQHPGAEGDSRAAARPEDKSYVFSENATGMRKLAFRFGADEAEVTIVNDRGEFSFRCGYGVWTAGSSRMWNNEPRLVVAGASWADPHTLLLRIRAVETPFYAEARFTFGEDQVEVSGLDHLGGAGSPSPLRMSGVFADGVGLAQ